MDSPAENKRSAVLALVLLGALLIGTLVVFTVFNGEDDDEGDAKAAPAATATRRAGTGSGSGAAAGGAAPQSGSAAAVPPIVTPDDLAAAHRVMSEYMSGLSTFKHTDTTASWVPPLLERTSSNVEMKKRTVLPSGKAWAVCQQAKCSSEGKAVVLRDALIADELARGSGQTISSVVEVTATRSDDGKKTEAETNTWLVSARKSSGEWQVTGFDIYGLGNVGAPEPKGE
ncbi:hypothetical protein [Streptomyces sp. NBC_01565]|uniref:hypothetical protein n=1 Tax=unclassified Streptomyces TaxID=2593676 RepID=UPI002251D17E|nr:hypothetical protein [Streptomyces sp. NBC_01565]MCX4542406.1 hypothetical protein [Streptomyces sp. NBC_01565]